ncbi:hypothetical protein C2845_PM06G07860 [Panicum miliaceum]|uniref:F-box domain-containing protein n=1 Tax=Panicum miliaceum TaxID=4540 RepID=A0A3L6R9Z2_PANMI|nr:hypothetical protein C2845_PM06G07860 [Panicum miliaceum]
MPMCGRRKKVAVSGGSIDALPDDILGHILGFLPAPEAVRTCVLARRWRVLWKRATSLRITCVADSVEERQTVKERQKFVDHLLRLRGHTPLQMCDLRFSHFYDNDDELLLMNQWFWHVVTCGVRMFRLENLRRDGFHLEDMPLVSQHLTRLELVGVDLRNRLCDFSSCPSLEHLEIDTCYWCSDINISSESLKHLAITHCDFDIWA